MDTHTERCPAIQPTVPKPRNIPTYTRNRQHRFSVDSRRTAFFIPSGKRAQRNRPPGFSQPHRRTLRLLGKRLCIATTKQLFLRENDNDFSEIRLSENKTWHINKLYQSRDSTLWLFDGRDKIWHINPSENIPHTIPYVHGTKKETGLFSKMHSEAFGYSPITDCFPTTTHKIMC